MKKGELSFVIEKKSIKLFIAESDGDDDLTEVGYLTFLVDLSGFAIEFLEVSEHSRFKGFGYTLLTKAISHADSLSLPIFIQDNPNPAIDSIIEKAGYKKIKSSEPSVIVKSAQIVKK